MRNVVLARVDDRLIHGQVVSGWISYCGANVLFIIDDAIAENRMMKRVLKASVPSRMEILIESVESAAVILQGPPASENERILLLTKTPTVFRKLWEAGVSLTSVNLGGMGKYEGREPLFRNLSCTKAEREDLYALMRGGIGLYYQLVPEQKRIEAEKFLKK